MNWNIKVCIEIVRAIAIFQTATIFAIILVLMFSLYPLGMYVCVAVFERNWVLPLN